MVSEQQIQANRNNALLGGVKTEEGKEVSKYNALKHAILKQTVSDYEHEVFAELQARLEREFAPDGFVEEMLVERIALCYLKLFRIGKAENEYVQSILNPHVVETKDLLYDIKVTEQVVTSEGYIPWVSDMAIERVATVYSRYETTVENRLYRALHELERVKRLKKGDEVMAPVAIDVNYNAREMGSFGESITS